jgi:SPP1 gp7 family putative phage head morphogenesis protein
VQAFDRVMLPYRILGFKKGVEQGLLQGAGKTVLEDVFTHYVYLQLKQKSLYHASLAVGTTKDKLQELLGKAIEEGQSIDQLSQAIRQSFESASTVRSLRIARTELTDTINDGTEQTLRKEGYKTKEWSTVIDGRERETHNKANGQIVGINDLFKVGGESCKYPGDDGLSASERVNCRCATLGSGLPEDRKYALGRHFLRLHGSLEQKFVVSLARAFVAQRDRILSHFPQ